MKTSIWNRNYGIIVAGQALSLFANNILYFALSLYVLDLTSSGTVYGAVTALSVVPLLLLLPVGGVVTDWYNKKRILITTDFCTAALVALFGAGIVAASSLLCVMGLLMSLTVIEGFYTPCTQAMIPAVQAKENLVRANAVVDQIAITSNILGPVIGSVLYGYADIRLILLVALAALVASALLELFIQWPRTDGVAAKTGEKGISGFYEEFKEGLGFVREQKRIRRTITLTALVNLSLIGLFSVGMAYIIKLVLGYSGEVYGIAGACAVGASLLGSVLAGLLGERVRGSLVYGFVAGSCLCLLPVCLGFWLNAPRPVMLVLVTAMFMAEMCQLSIYSVYALSFIQKQTPPQSMGKVMSLVVMFSICTDPLGRIVYGVAFDHIHSAYLVLFTAAGVLAAVLYMKRNWRMFEEEELDESI